LSRHLRNHEVRGWSRRTNGCDVGNWESVQRAATEISQLDGLICCAGMHSSIGPAMTATPADWAETVHTNLTGTFFTIRALFEKLQRSPRRAKVICFSGGGATSQRPNFSAYGAAKTGIVRL